MGQVVEVEWGWGVEVESRLMLVDWFRYKWLGSQISTLTLALRLIQRDTNVGSLKYTSSNSTPFTRLGFRTKLTPNKQIRNNHKRRCSELPSPSPQDFNDIRSTTWTSLQVKLTLIPSRILTHRPWVSNHEIWFYQGSEYSTRHGPRSDGCTMLKDSKYYETSPIPPFVFPSWHLVLETARDYVYDHWDPHENQYPGLKTATNGRMYRFSSWVTRENRMRYHLHNLGADAMHAFRTLSSW